MFTKDSSVMEGCFLFLSSLIAVIKVSAEPTDYCQWETFTASCPDTKVIVVDSAKYGRMEYGRCIERDYGYVGCSIDVRLISDLRCSGTRSCEILIPDMKFDRMSPCPKDLTRYLLVDYHCQPVITPPRHCIGTTSMELTKPSGIIASVTTDETGCGSTSAPWVIKGRPGQRISLTMTDFALRSALINDSLSGEGAVGPGETCQVYAIVKERHVTKQVSSKTICGGQTREGNVLVTSSNELELRVLTGTKGNNKRHFLVEYKIIGCPDLPAPVGGWFERHGDVITAGCTEHKADWQVKCVDDRWSGVLGNCSTATESGMLSRRPATFTQTLSIVVILAVALGIGAMILCVGLVCIRRRRRMAEGPDEVYVTTGPRPACNKDPLYRTANATYNGYTPPNTRSDISEENDYEYVDDIRPPVAPSGEPKITAKAASGSIKETCAMHRGNNAYTKYGTNVESETVGKHPVTKTVPFSAGGMGQPPQYFELDPEELQGGGVKGNVYHGNVTVAAHGGSQIDTREMDRKQNFSFGHYSQ